MKFFNPEVLGLLVGLCCLVVEAQYPYGAMQGQPMQGQLMLGQPMQGQPMQGQPMLGQPMQAPMYGPMQDSMSDPMEGARIESMPEPPFLNLETLKEPNDGFVIMDGPRNLLEKGAFPKSGPNHPPNRRRAAFRKSNVQNSLWRVLPKRGKRRPHLQLKRTG